jgi:hypothetical protein
MIDRNLMFVILLKLGREERLTPEENITLQNWCKESEDNRKLAVFFIDKKTRQARLEEMSKMPSERRLKYIYEITGMDKKVAAARKMRKRRLRRYIFIGLLLAAVLASRYCRLAHHVISPVANLSYQRLNAIYINKVK